ncbi:hypothetical protein ACLB2K_007001 [Fragaria x ananassa]
MILRNIQNGNRTESVSDLHCCMCMCAVCERERTGAMLASILIIKEGGVRFTIDGSSIFISVLISNVAGAGDIAAVKIKGSRTGWLPMGRNWGQNWHINADLKNQPLSLEVTSSDGLTLTSYNVAPKMDNWCWLTDEFLECEFV